jgi:lipopolysaccharide biosynthesis glycosyltransferase
LLTLVTALGSGLEFHRVHRERLADFPAGPFHQAAWCRVFLPELLTNLDKVVYLDSDLIVTDSLVPLWETDISGHLLAAVTNPLYPFMPDWPTQVLGLPDRRQYFNSGVLLMNLASMRTAGCTEELRRYARNHPDNRCPDQDALSALFHSWRLPLHPRWNVQTTLFDLPASLLPFSPAQVQEALEAPAVIHFIGPFKPWQYLCRHPLQQLYFDHLEQTPWPVRPLEGRTPVNVLLRPLPLIWQERLLRWAWMLRPTFARLRRVRRAVADFASSRE